MTLLLGKYKRYSQGHIGSVTQTPQAHYPAPKPPTAGILKEEVRALRPLRLLSLEDDTATSHIP
ncbi:hypothetical protein [Rothia nasimurium]|uniref:hypothetical protein n=1 Tax=Rothia nasimurium TaxID=85336 RepID=UPI001F1ADA45|nr:hypothetical protein [Rothia nasimurium]